MSQNEPNSPQVGTFAEIREYYTKAADYDAGFHRHRDNLVRLDRWTKNILAALTAVTSLGTFSAFFVHNPAIGAKATVFAFSALTSILIAVRRNVNWAVAGEQSKTAGDRWLTQRNQLRDLAARLCDGRGPVTESEMKEISTNDQQLVAGNPDIPNRLYDKFKKSKGEEFDNNFRLSTEKHATS